MERRKTPSRKDNKMKSMVIKNKRFNLTIVYSLENVRKEGNLGIGAGKIL